MASNLWRERPPQNCCWKIQPSTFWCVQHPGIVLLRLMRVMKSLRAIRMVRSLRIFRGLRLSARAGGVAAKTERSP